MILKRKNNRKKRRFEFLSYKKNLERIQFNLIKSGLESLLKFAHGKLTGVS